MFKYLKQENEIHTDFNELEKFLLYQQKFDLPPESGISSNAFIFTMKLFVNGNI